MSNRILDLRDLFETPKKKVNAAPAKTKAQLLFQGQKHPKKQKKIVRLEQWVEVRIIDGKTVTQLYPSNEKLIKDGQKMWPATSAQAVWWPLCAFQHGIRVSSP